MIQLSLQQYPFKIENREGKNYIFDIIRRKYYLLTPEEWVRQNIIYYLIKEMHYPSTLISMEKTFKMGALVKRYDALIYSRAHEPWMLIECKEPEVRIDEKVLRQVLSYHQIIQCPYWLITNGTQTYCAEITENREVVWMNHLPIMKGQ